MKTRSRSGREDARASRSTATLRLLYSDHVALADAITSGNMPVVGMTGWLDIDPIARSITIEGSPAAIANAASFLKSAGAVR